MIEIDATLVFIGNIYCYVEISGYLCAIKYVNMQGACLNNIKVSAIMFGSLDYFVSKQASKQASKHIIYK